jgi:ATP-dependent DNA helicase RecQ
MCEVPRCLPQQLLEYFGEQSAPCGNCGHCRGEHGGGALPGARREELTLEEVEMIRAAKAERHPALRQPRQLARFLCGLTSPATSRARLQRDDRFGALSEMPFLEVLAQAESF